MKLYRDITRSVKALMKLPRAVQRLERELAQHRREVRLMHIAQTLPPVELWANRQLVQSEPGAGVLPTSTGCKQAAFEQPWFSYWTSQFQVHLAYHRKLWEYVFICQALWERGALKAGARGLGFGVGTEPLSPWFAAHDCKIVATDMATHDAQAKGWADSAQHGQHSGRMQWPAICSREMFDLNVTLRECDMNAIPSDLKGFDFCWSSCALEHLGSIEHGLAFIERSIECLRPGGWAVHTTEFNLGSNDETVDHGATVLFRRQDFEALAARLGAKGHLLAPLDFDPGFGTIDGYLDVPPYRDEPCLKIALMGFATTSFGLIIQRGP